MMVSDHVDDFEWLNILTIGHYFVGEIHGHGAMLQFSTLVEPTAENVNVLGSALRSQ